MILRPDNSETWTILIEGEGGDPGLAYAVQSTTIGVEGVWLIEPGRTTIVRGVQPFNRFSQFKGEWQTVLEMWPLDAVLRKITPESNRYESLYLIDPEDLKKNPDERAPLVEAEVDELTRQVRLVVHLDRFEISAGKFVPDGTEQGRHENRRYALAEFLELIGRRNEYMDLLGRLTGGS